MKIAPALVACALLTGLPGPASADDSTSFVRITYARQCHDFLTGDLTSYAATMAPDYASILPDGTKQTRQQSLDELKRTAGKMIVTSCNPQIESVVVSGKTYTVKVHLRLAAVALAPLVKGVVKGDQLDSDIRAVDTWIANDDGTLILASTTATGVQNLTNGVVVNTMGKM